MVTLLTLLALGFGLLMGWWLWSPTRPYQDLQTENQTLQGAIETLQGELLGLHKEVQVVRTAEAREWALDGAKNVNVEEPMGVVKALVSRDESQIITDYGYGSVMHQAFLDRNGAPGDERIPLGIKNIVTGTETELAGALVDHGPNGGRLAYQHFSGIHIATEDEDDRITPGLVAQVVDEISLSNPDLVK